MEKILPLIFDASDEEHAILTKGLNFISEPMCNAIPNIWVWPETKKDHFDGFAAHCHSDENNRICLLRGNVTAKILFHEAAHALHFTIGQEKLNKKWASGDCGKEYLRLHFIKERAACDSAYKDIKFPAKRFIELYSTTDELEDIATFVENALDFACGNKLSPITALPRNDPYWKMQLNLLHSYGFFTKEQAEKISNVISPLLLTQ